MDNKGGYDPREWEGEAEKARIKETKVDIPEVPDGAPVNLFGAPEPPPQPEPKRPDNKIETPLQEPPQQSKGGYDPREWEGEAEKARIKETKVDIPEVPDGAPVDLFGPPAEVPQVTTPKTSDTQDRIAKSNQDRLNKAQTIGEQNYNKEQQEQSDADKFIKTGSKKNVRIESTTGLDRYQVTYTGDDGVPKVVYLNGDQIGLAGLNLPEKLTREQIYTRTLREDGPVAAQALQDKWAEDEAYKPYVEKLKLSKDEIKRLGKLIKDDPDNPELTSKQEIISALRDIATITRAPMSNVDKIISSMYEQTASDVSANAMQYQSLKNYADSHKISISEAIKLANLAVEDPEATEFKKLSDDDKAILSSSQIQQGVEYVFKKDYQNLVKENPELAEILKKKGLSPLNVTIKNVNEQAAAEKAVYEENMRNFEKSLDEPDALPGAKEAYEKGGIKGYLNFVKAYENQSTEQAFQTFDALLIDLPPEQANKAKDIRNKSNIFDALKYVYSERDKVLNEMVEEGYIDYPGKLRKGEEGPEVSPAMKKPTNKANVQYDIVEALQKGFNPAKIKAVFGEPALSRAQKIVSVTKIVEENGDIPTALLNKKITISDIKDVYGEDLGSKASSWMDRVNKTVEYWDARTGSLKPRTDYTTFTYEKDHEPYDRYLKSGGKRTAGQWAGAGRPETKADEGTMEMGSAENINFDSALRQAGIYKAYRDKFDKAAPDSATTWREFVKPEDKLKVAVIYNSFVNPKSDVIAWATAFETAGNENRLTAPKDLYKLPGGLVFGMASAVITPFTKEAVYKEMGQTLNDKYAVKDEKGNVTGYNLTSYVADRPFDSENLIRGGFDADAVKRAQEGQNTVANPQRATALDWITSALTVGTLFTGAIASAPIQLGLLGATTGVFGYQYAKGVKDMTWTERVTYGAMMALPFIKIGKEAVIYGVRKPIDIIGKGYNPESIRLRKGMPEVEVQPGMGESGSIDAVRLGQESAQRAKVDILAADARGNYTQRINPIQRATNLLSANDTYEFTSHGNEKIFTDAFKKAKKGKLPEMESGTPRTGAYREQVSTFDFSSENAWLERGSQTGKKTVMEGLIIDKKKGFDPYPDAVQKLIDAGDQKGAQKLLVDMNEQGLLAGKRFPAFRMMSGGKGQFIEPETITGAGTKKYIVGKGYVRSPQDMYAELKVKPELEVAKPKEWANWTKGKQESWYREQGAMSSEKSARLEAMKPKEWEDMSADAQSRWLYDNGASVKMMAKGGKIPIYWTSTDPNAKPPGFITRVTTELGTEPFTRLKRAVRLFDPNKTRYTTEYGEETRLPGLEQVIGKSKNQGQAHVGTYNNEYFNVKVPGTGANGTGQTVFGDFHGKYGNFKKLVNWAYDKNILSGKEGSLKWNGEREHITLAGDLSDRGPHTMKLWKDMLNLHDQANATGGKVDVLLGNHDLAHITGDKINGIRYDNPRYEAKLSGLLRKGILEGKIKAATVTDEGGLVTHAGLSLEKFPEYRGKSPQYIANDLNAKLVDAVKRNNFKDKMFDQGALDGGEGVGGIFWYRPGESAVEHTTLGYRQLAGHTPTITRGGSSWAVSDRGGITYVDTARWWDKPMADKAMNFYADTPTTKAMRTGEVFARPGEGDTITFPLDSKTAKEVSQVISNVKKYMGKEAQMEAVEDVGLTVKVPKGMNKEETATFVNEFTDVLSKTEGDLKYGMAGGYPNTYRPSHIYLGLKDDVSLANLAELQRKVDMIGAKLGRNKGDFKIQAGMTLGEATGTKAASQKFLNIMRDQANDTINTKFNGYQKSNGKVKPLSAATKSKVDNALLTENDMNTAAKSEGYPPSTPAEDEYINPTGGQVAVSRARAIIPTALSEVEQAALSNEAAQAVSDYPVPANSDIFKLAENSPEYENPLESAPPVEGIETSEPPSGETGTKKPPVEKPEEPAKSSDEYIAEALEAEARGRHIEANRLLDKAQESLEQESAKGGKGKSLAKGLDKVAKAKRYDKQINYHKAVDMLGTQRLIKSLKLKDIEEIRNRVKELKDLDSVQLARLAVKAERIMKRKQTDDYKRRSGERTRTETPVGIDYSAPERTLREQYREENNIADKPAREKAPVEKPVAEKAAPEKPANEKPSPEKVVPEKTVPEKTVPEKTVPEKTVPEKVTPEKTTPYRPTDYKPDNYRPYTPPPPYKPPPPYGDIHTPPPVVTTNNFHDIGKGKTDKEKREIIANAYAKVTYMRGKLKDSDKELAGVWHTFVKIKKDSEWERVVVRGPKPEGAVYADGVGSATKTMQRLSGGEHIDIREDTGAIDTAISGDQGQKKPDINFVYDNKKNNGRRVTIKEVEDKNERSGKSASGSHSGSSSPKPPREFNLGAGVIQEGLRGKRHIKLI